MMTETPPPSLNGFAIVSVVAALPLASNFASISADRAAEIFESDLPGDITIADSEGTTTIDSLAGTAGIVAFPIPTGDEAPFVFASLVGIALLLASLTIEALAL